MELSNIKVGDEFKNYPKLCRALGEKQRTGSNGKKYHIRELRRFMDIDIIGRKYVVKNVYSEPKEKVDNRLKEPIVDRYGEKVMGVYILCTEDGYFYIGASKDIRGGYFRHRTKEKFNKFKYDKLMSSGFIVLIHSLHEDYNEMLEEEICLIHKFKRSGLKILNGSDGGESSLSSGRRSKEHLKKNKKSNKVIIQDEDGVLTKYKLVKTKDQTIKGDEDVYILNRNQQQD